MYKVVATDSETVAVARHLPNIEFRMASLDSCSNSTTTAVDGVETIVVCANGSDMIGQVQNGAVSGTIKNSTFAIDIKDAGQYGEWLLANTTESALYSLPVEVLNTVGLDNAITDCAVAGAIYKVGETLYVIEEQDGTLVYKKLVTE